MTLLDMENKEGILLALKGLEKDSSSIPAILEEYLREVAKHGQTIIPWVFIKPLILRKFNCIMDEFIEEFSLDDYFTTRAPLQVALAELRQRVYDVLSQFNGTPFTIQRLCELLIQPRKHYTRPDKFLRGVEKTCLVVSTIDCFGNKIHHMDPRFAITRDESSLLNGSLTEVGSMESADDTTSITKRSDDEDDEEDEDDENLPKTPKETIDESNDNSRQTTPAHCQPCINFHRPLATGKELGVTKQSSPSKFEDSCSKAVSEVPGIQTSNGDSCHLTSSTTRTIAIHGKHTLQRPFLTLSRAESMGGEAPSFRPFNNSPGTSPDKDLQRMFPESDSPMNEIPKSAVVTSTTVPSIDQMLRPMGQLEAFVNTISMGASDVVETTTTVIQGSLPAGESFIFSQAESFSVSSTVDSASVIPASPEGENDEKIGEDFVITATSTDEEEVEDENGNLPSCLPATVAEVMATPRSSLKRESPVFDPVLPSEGSSESEVDSEASPAKRPRIVQEPGPAINLTALSTAPVPSNVDQESGEWVLDIGSEINTAPATAIVSTEDSGESSPTMDNASVVATLSEAALDTHPAQGTVAHIDSETGEQES